MPKVKPFKDNMMVINLTSHKFPQFKEVHGKDWIYYGEKNDYPQFLLDLYYKCSKHNAIVNGKVKYIAGAGWGDEGDTLVNSEKETLDNLTWKITLDMELYGGFAIEVIYKNNGMAEIRHVDFSNIRTNKDLTEFYYTKGWHTKYGTPTIDPKTNEDWTVYEPFEGKKAKEPTLIYYKCYSPGLNIYPLPEYKASLQYIELEFQIANYWYNRVKNGFMPSAILNFYMGQPTDDAMRQLEEKIKGKFSGTNNAGQFILNFAPNKDSAADIQQITPPELGAEYEVLNNTLQTEIFTGHGVTNGMLFGIKEAGQLGGRSELIEANELFQNRYVSPVQHKLNSFFNDVIFPLIGIKEAKLQKQEPIGYMFSESILVKYLPSKAISKMVAEKMGIDLAEYPEFEQEQKEKKEQQNVANAFKKSISDKEKSILAKLKAKGKKRKYEVIHSRAVTFEMAQNLKASEQELKMDFAKKPTPIVIGSPVTPIATPKTPTEVISIVYTYEWLDGFSDANIGTSRDFCVEMRELTKMGFTWTREDIDSGTDIPTEERTDDPFVSDIFESRGGWWNDDGVNVPHCRHIWNQKVIREIL